jgi:transcriptional regulator with XRE-family HTH domain
MLSKTLQDGLNDYEIGAKIRALRLKKKIGLVDLGKHTGLSPALLSKIERSRLFPHAADPAADCARLRRRPGVLLRRGA